MYGTGAMPAMVMGSSVPYKVAMPVVGSAYTKPIGPQGLGPLPQGAMDIESMRTRAAKRHRQEEEKRAADMFF